MTDSCWLGLIDLNDEKEALLVGSLLLQEAVKQAELVSRALRSIWGPLFAPLDGSDGSVDVVVSPAPPCLLRNGAEKFQGLLTGLHIGNRLWGDSGLGGYSLRGEARGQSQQSCCEGFHFDPMR